MERERKSGVEEFFVLKKLRGGKLLCKREGNSTPSPPWKFGLFEPDGSLIQDSNFPSNTTLSARKLCANLWELQSHLNPNMNKEFDEFKVSKQLSEPPDRPTEQATRGNILKNDVTSLTTKHSQRLKNVDHVQEPVSTASYCSSMEMAPYRPDHSRSNSLDSKGKFGASSYGRPTSTELLKVLNRIWKLEEKHALNMSLIKTLKKELEYSNIRIKKLLQQKQRDQQEDKVARVYTEQKKMKDACESILQELEDERKLRRRSENLHHKLARELSEVKSSFANALAELKQERKARILLEDLCDEFAKGIRDNDKNIRLLRQKSDGSQIGRDENDQLILHISEAWLDERKQIKLANPHGVAERPSVLDRLRIEIETFLRAKQSGNSEITELPYSELPKPTRKKTLSREEEAEENLDESSNIKKDMPNNSIRNPSVALEHNKPCNEDTYMENSFDPSKFTGPSSPVLKWTSEVKAADLNKSESFSRWPRSFKPNTLQAKLMEARLQGQQPYDRVSKGSSQVD